MQSKEKNNLVFIRLFPGEDVYDCLRNVCQKHDVKTAVVLSGLGQLGSFELGFFRKKGDYAPQKFNQPHELLMLAGVISKQKGGEGGGNDYQFHLHVVLSGEDKQVVGGHFIAGKVSITGEIVLLKTDLEIKRQKEQETGLMGLFLD